MNPKFLAFLLLLPAMASASSPWFVGEMSARVSFSGEIDVVPSEQDNYLNWLEGSFFIVPQESNVQSSRLVSISPHAYSFLTDQFGNDYLSFRWESPSAGTLAYSVLWDVNTSRLKYALTSAGSLDQTYSPDIQLYLQPDNLTTWTGYMKSKAQSLVNGSNNTLEAARRLSLWVSSQIRYDRSCWDVSYPASRVFVERIGVCDEFTNLFISLCRSVGIPARYVEGLVYSSQEWNFHAWAEIYTDRWVPIDPTYNEVGFVDSSHITLASVKGDDNVFNTLNWQGLGISVNFGVEDLDVMMEDPSVSKLLHLSLKMKDELASSEIINVTAKVSNLANSPVVATCSLSMPPEMLLLDDKEKSVLLSPQGAHDLSWRIAPPPDLDQQWLHKMPLQVSCFPGTNVTEMVTVDPRKTMALVPQAVITDLTVLNRTAVLIVLRSSGTKELEDLIATVCLSDLREVCFNKTVDQLGAGESSEIQFKNLPINDGTVVSAKVSSRELEAYSEELLLSELESPRRTEQPAIQPETVPDLNVGADQNQLIILTIILILVLVVIAAFAAVCSRR